MTTAYSGDGITFPDSTVQATAPRVGMVNRVINGDMRIDQRNAGAGGTASAYTVDRWAYFGTQASKGTWQQNAGAITPPSGFKNYLGFTSSSAYPVSSTDLFELYQFIEGYNLADLEWGTSSAKTATLSFWVRSSLTGTFGGAVSNSGNTRNYPFTYTINIADTWEQKTITVVGDTTGTWLSTNTIGCGLILGLGAGSTFSETGNAWNGTTGALIPTGATSVVGTSGATFYVTGVQLEKGSTATSFEYVDYSRQLQMCQRYFVKYGGKVPSEVVSPSGMGSTTTNGVFFNSHPVDMRAQATISFNAINLADSVNPAVAVTSMSLTTGTSSTQISSVVMFVASGIAAYRPLYARTISTSGFLNFSAEL